LGHGTPQLTLAGAAGAAPSSHLRLTLSGVLTDWARASEKEVKAKNRRESWCFMGGGDAGGLEGSEKEETTGVFH
jgi:hypothetical protein